MSNIKVSPEQLQALGSRLNSGSAEIDSILSSLASQVQGVAAEWEGQAQAQYQVLWAEWHKSATGIKHALQGVSQLTNQAGQGFATSDSDIARTFAQ